MLIYPVLVLRYWSTRHPTLLLPGSQLQVSPLKDLVTMRNPCSSFSFTNYLHQNGRLAAYINREENIPCRREWSAYLAWAARQMEDVVSYGEEVIAVEPVSEFAADQLLGHTATEGVRLLKVITRHTASDQVRTRITRNLTVGAGGTAHIPAIFKPIYPKNPWTEASRVFHSSTFLPSLAAIEPTLSDIAHRRMGRSSPASASMWPLRLAVIGGGQSSAETLMHLHRTFPSAHISMIFRASALVPSDDSPFVNAKAFDPESTDSFWKAGDKEREDWKAEFRRTNYSVVRSDLLNQLNTLVYDQSIELPQPFPGAAGPDPGHIELLSNTVVDDAKLMNDEDDEFVELALSSTKMPDQERTQRYDAVVLGTGFRRSASSMFFLKPLEQHFPMLGSQADRDAAVAKADAELDPENENEVAEERRRERTRGITRDYRLVSYSSPAFHPQSSTGVSAPSSGTNSPSSEDSSITLGHNNIGVARSSGDKDAPRSFEPTIYLMGGNEATHGLSDSLLSIVAHRSGEITQSFLDRARGGDRAPESRYAHEQVDIKSIRDRVVDVKSIHEKVEQMKMI